MKDAKVRINKITLWDFKSVAHGVIDLNTMDSFHRGKSSIMGLYGQNASGKTVLIEVLSIIKHIMQGEQVPHRYLESVSVGKDECSIEVEFLIENEEYNFDCTAIYKCTLAKRDDPNVNEKNNKKIISVISECLQARGKVYGEKIPLQDVARTNESYSLILPAKKCALLFGADTNKLKTIEQQKLLALYGSRSFIFSSQATNAMIMTAKSRNEKNVNWPLAIIAYLFGYMGSDTFVINEQAALNLDFHFMVKNAIVNRPLELPGLLGGSIKLSNGSVTFLEEVLHHLNEILSSIVAGLTVEYKSEKVSLDNNEGYLVELFSNRKGIGIFPFKNESLGIKKIVSFILLLAEAYNNPSFTLVVDEIDTSIFEYLLGEMLDIMSSSGKGQLIFTSHNLHPLEKLDAKSIWFTTTDPKNRYAQMNKKATNNLRNMYLRAIHLGDEESELYNGNSKQALAYAFRKMGRNK